MEKLAIRLGSTPHDPVHWLVWSDTEKEIIASGELPDIDGLAQLKERAPNAEVVCIVPGCDVVLKTVQLPARANRKVLNAIPFMLEDEIASDIAKSFFAFGRRIGDSQQVAVVLREQLEFWQGALKQADLYCDLLVPDTLALPYSENTTSLLSLGHHEQSAFIVRAGEWAGYQGEKSWTLVLLEKQLKTEPQSVLTYSEQQQIEYLEELFVQTDAAVEAKMDAPTLTANYDKLPMQLLLDGALDANFNLLQGDFALKRKTTAQWDKWRFAAVLAGVALCVNLVGKTVELNSIKNQRQNIETRLQTSISQGFPNLPRSRNKEVAIRNEMARLEQGGGGISMLVMLTQMSPSFASTGVTPQSIRYDASRTELRMQSVANNFESLEKFRREVQALGFEVDQGAINNKGDQVVGTIIIKG
jgi:general secretion pathway protein L